MRPRFVSSFRANDVVGQQTMEKIYVVFEEAIQEPADYNRPLGARIAQVGSFRCFSLNRLRL